MYPEFSVLPKQHQQPYMLHTINQSYNPVVNDIPRPRQPNENPKDYMLNSYTSLIHVMDLTASTSIYRIDPFAKYLCCWINQVCPEEVQAIQERTKWKHPNLVSFIFFEDISDKYSPTRQLKIYYEYLPLDVKQLIVKRGSLQEYVPEQEIWSMIQGLCAAMSFLQKRGITHQALSLESVYFDEEYLIYRIQDVSPFRARAPHMFENQFNAPECYGSHRVNRFKADVFAMGMIVLSLCLLQDCKFIYDQMGLNRLSLSGCLDKLRRLYPGRIDVVVNRMLLLDANERSDWNELQGVIQNSRPERSNSVRAVQKTVESMPPMSSLPPLAQENSSKDSSMCESFKKGESIDQKLMNLNKKIQETLARSQNKGIR